VTLAIPSCNITATHHISAYALFQSKRTLCNGCVSRQLPSMAPRVMDLSHRSGVPDNSLAAPMSHAELSPKDIQLPPSPPVELINVELDQKKPAATYSPFDPTQTPAAPRRVTSPEPTTTQGTMTTRSPAHSPRNPSPSRPNLRPSYSSSAISLPLQRAHSSPGVDSTGRFVAPGRPSSPLGHYGRRRSPLRTSMEEPYPGTSSWSGLNIEPNIPEHEELDISSRYLPLASVSESDESSNLSPLYSLHNTFPRSRRRPHSPLHQSASAPALFTRATSPSKVPGGSSPWFLAQKYTNEPYPSYSFSSASSMPSTPTSLRSRSPSISSLETIEDTPDAEEAARIEAEEEMAKLKADEGEGSGDLRRRSSLELRRELRSNKERKRWSVCGAERRADFSLEPIEE
jgi:hypothetical protein